MPPDRLKLLAIAPLIAALVSLVIIAGDILSGRRQHMWIMNIVWPITALYAGPIALWAYFRIGRALAGKAMHAGHEHHISPQRPFWQTTALATTHCGSGCTLGDLLAEPLLAAMPFSLFGSTLYGGWALDFVFALLIGLVFQYFTIVPMRHLSFGAGVAAAFKADALSLTAWQLGMYGWMAIAVFVIFGHELPRSSPVFWFMMQIAMCAGFLTGYPINWWLLRKGIKEAM